MAPRVTAAPAVATNGARVTRVAHARMARMAAVPTIAAVSIATTAGQPIPMVSDVVRARSSARADARRDAHENAQDDGLAVSTISR